MNNASSALAAAGNSYEKSVALLTAANTTMQNASKASTGLRTITARLRNTKTELDDLGEAMTESQYDEVVQALTNMNVKLVDVNGNYRDTYDIFKDIAAQWDKMSSTDQAALATKLSGTRMQAVFYSLVQNFGEAEKAMEAMGAAEGELTEKNEVFANSIEGRMNQFRNEFKKLGTEIFTSDWIKDAVSMAKDLIGVLARVASAITSIVKALGGVKVVLPAILATYTAFKIGKGISNIISMGKAIAGLAEAGKSYNLVQKLMIAGNAAMTESSAGALTSIKALASGLFTTAAGFTSVAAAIAGISVAIISSRVISNYNKGTAAQKERISEASDGLVKAKENLKEASDAAKNLNSELNTTRNRIRELQGLKSVGAISLVEEKELDDLTQYNDELERSLALEERKIKIEEDRKKAGLVAIIEQDTSHEYSQEHGTYRQSDAQAFMRSRYVGYDSYFNDDITYENRWVGWGPFRVRRTVETPTTENSVLDFYQRIAQNAKKYESEFLAQVVADIESDLDGIDFMPDPKTNLDKKTNEYIRALRVVQDRVMAAMGEDPYNEKAFERLMRMYGFPTYEDYQEAKKNGDILATYFEEDFAKIGGYTLKEGFDNSVGVAIEGFFASVAKASAQKSNVDAVAESIIKLRNALGDMSKASQGLGMLDKIYADVLDKGKFDFTALISDDFVETFGSLNSFDSFLETVANAPDDIEACQGAFNALTAEYIMQSGCLQDLDEDTRAMMLRFLAEQGVIDDTGEAADRLTQIYKVLDAQKKLLEEHKLETSSDVDALIALATQADATSASIIRLTNAKAMLAKAEAIGIQIDSNPEMNVKEAQRLEQLAQRLTEQATAILSKPIEFDLVKINYSGGDTTQGVRDAAAKETEKAAEDAAKEAAKNTKTWFEEQYAEHKHLVAMEKETDYEYYTWLEGAMKKAYAEGILSQEDYWKYEEEVYNGMKKLRENAEKEAQSNFDKLVDIRKKMLEKEVSDQKDALNDQLKNLKDFYDKQRKMLQDSYDEEDYLEEQAEKRKSVSDLEEELARLRYDDSAWAQKRRAEISQQIADARKDLNDFERDHARDEALSFLDEQEEAAEAKINSKLDALEEKAKSAKELNDQAIEDVKNGTAELYREMIEWNAEYGDGLTETVTAAWNGLYQAASDYKQLVGTIFNGVKIANVTGYKLQPIGKGYASGTSYAVPGLHPIDEKGSETYFSPSTGGKYKMFSGGEKVLTAKASDFLYRFANGGSEMLKKFIASVGGGVLNDRLTPVMTNNEIVMGDVVVQGNVDRSTVSEIRRAQRESVEFMLKEFGKLNR